ncbi:NTPase KAP family P-loop domain-containing protein 1-like [Notamacropus eugenii]|uniref:NTPase KAP family P-loop domain-containing protein 1-like n=1 Tax=Notamacropus eugenii TaxID=9315 RepID=UPI003B67BE0B
MYVPEIPTDETNTHYIFVPFQAWEFAGSDFLWAGLVTTLCDCIEEKYWLPLIFYKLFGISVQDSSDAGRKLMKRWLTRIFFTFLVMILIGIGLCSYIFDLDTSDSIEGLLIPGAIISVMTLWNFVRGIYAFFQNSKESINKLMNSSKVSNQLGFMHSVKEKIEVLTKFLCVLGAYNKQQIKVVLQISHLDACSPEKVMGALEALRILHSDPEAPFISILAADSKVVAESVERSRRVGSLTGSGYQYLNQFITLPFSVPHMNKEAKKNLLDEIEHSTKTNKQNDQKKKRRWSLRNHNGDFEDGRKGNRDLETSVTDQFQTIITHLKEEKIAKFLPNNQAHMKRVVYTSWITLNLREQKFDDKPRLAQKQILSMEEKVWPIKEGQKQQLQKTNWEPNDEKWDQNREVHREVIAWVLLANEWPCRVSWMLQCAQDDQQWREIHEHSKGQNDPQPSGTKQQPTVGIQRNFMKYNTNRPYVPEAHESIKLEDSLGKAFVKAVAELDSIKEEVTKLMELDGDPEIFLKMLHFLDEEFRFTVQKALNYWDITTNLDGSLKRHMELIRGSRTLKQAARCQRFLPLSLLKMSTEDVCQVLEQNARALGISDTNMKQYIEKIRKENLSGRALVYSLNSEIKKTLGMTLGDWASFSISFLNVLPETNSSLADTLKE